MHFVYLLRSKKDKTFYVGSTNDLKKRLKEHNQGKTKSIRCKLPMSLIYFEAYVNKKMARKRELELKNNSFRKKELLNRFEF